MVSGGAVPRYAKSKAWTPFHLLLWLTRQLKKALPSSTKESMGNISRTGAVFVRGARQRSPLCILDTVRQQKTT